MAAMFAGASRALLASVVFAFETTRQPIGLLPLLGGCTASYMMSFLLMRNSIMTEKIERRGVRVLGEYTADFLEQVKVRSVGLRKVVTLAANEKVEAVRTWLDSCAEGTGHQSFPVLDEDGLLVGVLTRRELFNGAHEATSIQDLIVRRPIVIYDDNSLREAANLMARERIGRLPVVTHDEPRKVVGILTRSDLVQAHLQRLDQQEQAKRSRQGFRPLARS
jgi:CBS domain-containing protein